MNFATGFSRQKHPTEILQRQTVLNKMYVYINFDISINWTCFKATLASIPDDSTNSFLQNLSSENWAWIGAYRIGNGVRDFAWEDGSPWSYTNWSPNDRLSSDEYCAHMNYESTSTRSGAGFWRYVECKVSDQYSRLTNAAHVQ